MVPFHIFLILSKIQGGSFFMRRVGLRELGEGGKKEPRLGQKKQLVACAGGEHHFLGHTIKTVASGKWCDTPPQQGEKTG